MTGPIQTTPQQNVPPHTPVVSFMHRMVRAVPNWFWPDVLAPFLITRATLCFVGLLAINLLSHPAEPGKWDESSQALINIWSRWDAGWYMAVARSGYSYHPGQQSSIAFFPLYPLLMRLVAALLGRQDGEGYLLSGILISNACLLIALIYLVLLLRLDFGRKTVSRAVFYLLIFPTSFFLSAVYTESLFLALTVSTFYHARQKQWWVAGIAGGCAALTRPPGILLFAPLAYEYLVACQFDIRQIRVNIGALALVPAGFASYVLFLYWRFHKPFVFMQVQSAWGRETMPPWKLLQSYSTTPFVWHATDHSFLDLCFAIFFGLLIVQCWGQTRKSYEIFVTLSFLVMVFSGTFQSIMRFGTSFFPLFIMIALEGRKPSLDRAYTSLAIGLGAFLMAVFAVWGWVA